jgi:hypothetical protein
MVPIPGGMGKKEAQWFPKAKLIFFSDPTKFLQKLQDFAKNERENINPSYINKLKN